MRTLEAILSLCVYVGVVTLFYIAAVRNMPGAYPWMTGIYAACVIGGIGTVAKVYRI